LSFFTQTPVGQVFARWQTLREQARLGSVVHARQVHGSRIITHSNRIEGITIHDAADGHLSAVADLTMAVSVADCVPIFLVDARARVLALLHAGWRGIAAGILELGLQQILTHGAGSLAEVYCHLGPAICGQCYEVGPEVHRALGLDSPSRPAPVDLRDLLVRRAVTLGLLPGHMSISEFCTRCHADLFFSHRAGHDGRQMGLLGIRSS
jgi:YfiH family protein